MPPETVPVEVAYLHQVRKAKRFTLQKLAAVARTDAPRLSRLERAEAPMSEGMALRLSVALDVPVLALQIGHLLLRQQRADGSAEGLE